MSGSVLVTLDGDKLVVAPTKFLSRSFDAYRCACGCAGAKWVAKEKRTVVPVDRLGYLGEEMRSAGFEFSCTPAVVEFVRARVPSTPRNDVRARIHGRGLFDYQAAGAEWLAGRTTALLADDMGLGKTVQALMALPEHAAAVVVCPAAVKGVWARECARWRPDLTPIVLKGRKSWRWPDVGELVVVNYDILPSESESVRAVTMIADEAHMLKNYKAARSERFTALGKSIRDAGGSTWLLTGTPLLGRPFDLWGVLGAGGMNWEAYGNWPQFLKAFNLVRGQWGGWEYGEPRPEAATGLARVCLRRRKMEVLKDLPPKRRQELFVEAALGESAAELESWLIDHDFDIESEWSDDDASKIPFEMISRVRHEIAVAKIPAMLEVVEEYEEAEEPLVVFSAHKKPVETLSTRAGWATITGETTPENRTAIVEQFQAGKLRGIALTIAAGGVGLTLTHASNMLLVDLEWTPALNTQAEDRVCRIGQTRPVLIKRLIVDHPIDRRMHEVLARKINLIEKTVERATTTDQEAVPPTAIERSLDVALQSASAGAADRATREAHTIDLGATPAGRYALRRQDGTVSFWILDRPDDGRWAGWSFLKHQVGPSHERYGAVRPDQSVTGMQGTLTVLTRIARDPEAAMRLYGHEIGACGCCGRELTNELSRREGIGPYCAAKMGWSHQCAGIPHDDATAPQEAAQGGVC